MQTANYKLAFLNFGLGKYNIEPSRGKSEIEYLRVCVKLGGGIKLGGYFIDSPSFRWRNEGCLMEN